MTDTHGSFIQFRCSRCFRELQAKRSAIGTTTRCPVCFTEAVVPAESEKLPEESSLYQVSETVGAVQAQDEITVSCPVCQTRVTAPASQEGQEGQEVPCPDCDTPVLMARPKPQVQEVADEPVDYEGDSIYGMQKPNISAEAEGDSGDAVQSEAPEPELIPVVCGLCGTRMYAEPHEVGQEKTCPDCYTVCIVPEPRPKPVEEERETKSYEGGTQYGLSGESEGDIPDGTDVIPVVCKLCGTRMYALASEVGQEKRCPDCDTFTVVPDKPPTKFNAEISSFGEYGVVASSNTTPEPRIGVDYRELQRKKDRDAAAGVTREDVQDQIQAIEESGYVEDQLTDEPVRIHVEERPEAPPLLYASRLFAFAKDWRFWWTYVFASLGLIWAFFLTSWVIRAVQADGFGSEITAAKLLFALIFAGPIGIPAFCAFCAVALIIFSDTAEGADNVESWPDELDIGAWFASAAVLVILAVLSMMPGYATGTLMMGNQLAGLLLGAATCFCIFPYVALSYLASGSVLEPISVRVMATWVRAPVAWGGFYLISAGVLGLLVVGPFALHALSPLTSVALAPPLAAMGFAIYFRLLGRLAWRCNEVFREQAEREEELEEEEYAE